MTNTSIHPEILFFKDDGKIPNSKLPVLIYKNAFSSALTAAKFKSHFASNNWTNAWDNGIYPFHHYHSISHEVLGVYAGSALLHLGGEQGKKVNVTAGYIIVIPAGVGHKNLGASSDFAVVGAYPDGRDWDLLKGEVGERPKADQNIATVPIPDADPLLGKTEGLRKLWTL
jgi:uncharacterized protein YjlB